MAESEDSLITRKLNLEEEGWGILFKLWQIPLVELLRGDTHTIVNPLRSREAWHYINEEKSRASVIFFLRDLAKWGWLKEGERTGKGGHHKVYWKAAPFDQFLDSLSFEVADKLQSLKEEEND